MKEIEELVSLIRGETFFLSPREKIFIETLINRLNIPEDTIKEGIKNCYSKLEPKKRAKYPLFLCFKEIMKIHKMKVREEKIKKAFDWKEAFKRKMELARKMIDLEEFKFPKTEEEAVKILRDIERKIFKSLWESLPEKEKKEIMRKFKDFKEEKELFKELIKAELRERFNIPDLSLYTE